MDKKGWAALLGMSIAVGLSSAYVVDKVIRHRTFWKKFDESMKEMEAIPDDINPDNPRRDLNLDFWDIIIHQDDF